VNDAIVMMLAVSGGFAALALIGALWWFAGGQYQTRGQGAAIPLDDDDIPTRAAVPTEPRR
jgi:nitrogen fixation-related uncharacterized protein